MFDEYLQALYESWKNAFGQYAVLKAQAEKAIFRWEWTSGERYSALPFHFARFPGRGHILKGPPDSAGNFMLYGFDDQDRLRIHRTYQYRLSPPGNFLKKLAYPERLSKNLYSETFYIYSDNRMQLIEYSIPPRTPIPLSIQQIYLENGLVTLYASLRLNGYTPLYSEKGKDPDYLYQWLGSNGRFKTVEAYSYAEAQLRLISGYYEVPGASPYSAQEQFTYDEAGKLSRIERVFEDGKKQLVYRRRNESETFGEIRANATQKLAEAIIRRIKTAIIQERIYCIQLNYRKFAEQFPPFIIAIPESYRLEILKSPQNDRSNIFFPIFEDQWSHTIDDPETLEMCQFLEQEIRASEKWDEATGILRDVAAILTRHDWSGILDITPDFVVFALDPELEGENMREILSDSVSQQQIQEWQDKGWLN